MAKQVLLIGSGGREHALAWKLAQSMQVSKVFCAPGNGGTATESKCENLAIKADDIPAILNWLKQNKTDLVVVGPELPLSLGLVDEIQKLSIPVFGPVKNSAELETSKAYAKQFMNQHNLPTAKFETFSSHSEALAFCQQNDWARVIKLDGLAAGKGVFVCDSMQECIDALAQIYENNPAEKILIEERLTGPEVSLFLLCDGKSVYPMPLAQDYKRRFEHNKGPNTGGMGSFSPVRWAQPYEAKIQQDIIAPLEIALQKLPTAFCGLLFVGILIHQEKNQKEKPYILEFNVRFGDPETQSILPRLNSDFYELLYHTATGSLKQYITTNPVTWSDTYSVCVNLVHNEYPQKSGKGEVITIGKLRETVKIFHAGTELNQNGLVTNGGRILSVVATTENNELSVLQAYEAIHEQIQFNNMAYRNDIATVYDSKHKELAIL